MSVELSGFGPPPDVDEFVYKSVFDDIRYTQEGIPSPKSSVLSGSSCSVSSCLVMQTTMSSPADQFPNVAEDKNHTSNQDKMFLVRRPSSSLDPTVNTTNYLNLPVSLTSWASMKLETYGSYTSVGPFQLYSRDISSVEQDDQTPVVGKVMDIYHLA